MNYKFKRLLACLLSLIIVVSVFSLTAFAAGEDETATVSEGTEWYDANATTLNIENKDDLLAFATTANAGKNFSGKTIKLTADIDLGGMTWSPIKNFLGTFDGGNHTISNFHLDATKDHSGFFYKINFGNGTAIKNLILSDITATVGNYYVGALAYFSFAVQDYITIRNFTVTTIASEANVGGYAGWVEWGHIRNCTIENMVVNAENGAGLVGGLAAVLKADNWLQYNNIDVNGFKVTINDTDGKYAEVGGLVGQTQTGHDAPVFTNCDIKGIDVTASGLVTVGGFVARPGAHTTAKNCTTEGKIDVIGVTSADEAAGGFFGNLGWNNNESSRGGHKLTDCAADVDIVTKIAPAGGFVGSATNEQNRNMAATFTQCSAQGEITVAEGGTATIGGFAGEADRGTYNNCTATQEPIFGKKINDTIVIKNFVAKIGDTSYESLVAAIDAAQDGDTVKLIQNILLDDINDVEARVAASNGNGKYCGFDYGNGAFFNVIDKDVTVDLNGYAITYDIHDSAWCNKRVVSVFYATDKSNLTITDSSEAKTGAVTVYGMATAVYSVAVDTNVTIEGGTWTWNKCDTCEATNIFLYASHGGELCVEGGNFVNNVDGDSGDYMFFSHYSSKETTENSAGVDYDQTKIAISGGTFVNCNPGEIKYMDQGSGNKEAVDTGCAEGFVPVENTDGSYGVKVWYDENATELEINNIYELLEFAELVNSGTTFSGKTVKLTNDIDLSSVANWTPIGNGTNYFWGTFDGQNHTISNMTIDIESTGNVYAGLFGSVKKATIKNLIIKDACINAVGARAYVGAVAGLAHSNSEKHTTANLNFENITVDGCTINAESKSGSAYVGGFIGYCYPANMTSISVKNATINPKATGSVFAGGLVGYMQGQNISNNGNTRAYYTVDTFNLKNITINSETRDSLIGGFAGYTYYGYITLKNATIDGFKVEADVTDSALVGGLIGLAHRSDKGNTFSNVEITGIDFDVVSDSGYDVILGGMVGYSGSPITYSDCSASGTITETTRNATSTAFVGGFVGQVASWSPIFEECSADVAIEASSNNVGGFAGCVSTNSTYTDCSATMDPFIGYYYSGTLTNNNSYVASVGSVYYANFANALAAVKEGDTVTLLKDVTIAAEIATINTSVGQAYTGIIIPAGVTFDGNGCTLTVTHDATHTWNSAVYMTGGTLKNLTIVGGNRGVLVNCPTEAITLDGVSVSNSTYALNTNSKGVNGPVELTVKNSTFNGWTSISNASISEASFENCHFGKSNRGEGKTDYAYFRPYCATTISGAETTFSEGFTIDGECATTIIASDVPATEVAKLVAEENTAIEKNEDGSYTVRLAYFVAQIGNTKYESLAAAVAAAKDGDVIVVTADHELVYTGAEVDGLPVLVAVEGKKITIDLNGKKITGNSGSKNLAYYAAFAVDNDGSLTLKDSVGTGSVEITGEFTMYSLLMAYEYGANNATKLIVEGGSYYLEKAHDSMIFCGQRAEDLVYIKGGKFELGNVGVGENGKPWIFNVVGSCDGFANITGGTFNADVNRQFWSSEAVVDKSCYTVDNGDGTYTIMPGAVAYVHTGMLSGPYYVPKNVGYAMFEEAFEAAITYNEKNITLLRDVTLSDILVINKAITLDGNGYKLTSTAARAINVSGADGVTIKNLTIECSGERAINIIQNATNVTIDNVTATAGNYTVNVAASAPKAVVVIKNSTLNGLCTVNVAAAGTDVTITDSTINCNDNNTTVGEAYAAINLNKDATNGKIVATGTEVNVTADSDSVKGRNSATNGTVVINGSSDDVEITVAIIDYPAHNVYHGFTTLESAFEFARDGDTVTLIRDIKLDTMIVNTKNITLDLNGKTITGTDNTTKNFSLIDNRGNLTVTGNGTMTLTATVNSGWNRYSAVIANNPGGKLVIENGTIEHLGGTDMAYGIDNLTNGKGTYAETVINGGLIKSTYRGIRQFLNGVEAENILTINGGTVEGANKSVWMHDPNTKANTGTLTVAEGASLVGDVYLFVTAGSTEYPVEVSIAASAVNGKIVTGNIPERYIVEKVGGVYTVNECVVALLNYSGQVKGYFKTIEEALSKASKSYTVKLLCDIEGPGLVINKSITINLNGYTYTLVAPAVGSSGTQTNGFQILKGNTVKLRNGKLEVAAEAADKFAILIQNYANLRLSNIVLDGTNLDYSANTSYTLSINSGMIYIDDDTTIIANDREGVAGDYAFDLYKDVNYSEPVLYVYKGVNLDVTGKIDIAAVVNQKNGNVRYYASFANALANSPANSTITLMKTNVLTEDAAYDLNGCTVKVDDSISGAPAFRVLADVTFNGGTVDATTGINSYAFIVGNNTTAGKLTIEGGTYKGITSVVSITNGEAYISGGTFKTAHDDEGTDYGAQYLLNCMDAAYNNGTAKYFVTGGYFYGFNPANNAAEGTNTNFCAPGYIGKVTDTDDVYTVLENNAAVKIGDTTYDSIAEALAAAKKGQTITLLRDIEEPGAVINKNITINFNGFTWTITEPVGSTGTESNGLQLLVGITVNLKNGKLTVAEESAARFYILIQNYAKLTITDMELDGTYLDKYAFADGYSYVVSNNSGSCALKGNTVITSNNDGEKAFALDACKFADYDLPVVTIANGVVIDGVEFSVANASKINIECAGYVLNYQSKGVVGYYATLEQAIAKATKYYRVVLMSDAVVAAPINIKYDIRIKMNGHTINGKTTDFGEEFAYTGNGNILFIK